MTEALDPATVERFARDLSALVPDNQQLGIAVSGGGDSLALLLLARAARPGTIEAVTVDHRLRGEGAKEARFVALICDDLDIPHVVRTLDWDGDPPATNIEARARAKRYDAIASWMAERDLCYVATGHHADDQAETLLMRLARGSGVAGLAGIRRSRVLAPGSLVRPLLDWTHEDLRIVVDRAGVAPAQDPHNSDPAFDRARLRAALHDAGFADARAYAASAAHLADAEGALTWLTDQAWKSCVHASGGRVDLAAPEQYPGEIQRRLLICAFDRLDVPQPRGPELKHALGILRDGGRTTLGGLLLGADGCNWSVSRAPPRRTG